MPYDFDRLMSGEITAQEYIQRVEGTTNVMPLAQEEEMPVAKKSWVPTQKWIVTQVTALAALATMWATTGSWDTEETIAAIGLVSQALAGYFKSNDDTPGGVPVEGV